MADAPLKEQNAPPPPASETIATLSEPKQEPNIIYATYNSLDNLCTTRTKILVGLPMAMLLGLLVDLLPLKLSPPVAQIVPPENFVFESSDPIFFISFGKLIWGAIIAIVSLATIYLAYKFVEIMDRTLTILETYSEFKSQIRTEFQCFRHRLASLEEDRSNPYFNATLDGFLASFSEEFRSSLNATVISGFQDWTTQFGKEHVKVIMLLEKRSQEFEAALTAVNAEMDKTRAKIEALEKMVGAVKERVEFGIQRQVVSDRVVEGRLKQHRVEVLEEVKEGFERLEDVMKVRFDQQAVAIQNTYVKPAPAYADLGDDEEDSGVIPARNYVHFMEAPLDAPPDDHSWW